MTHSAAATSPNQRLLIVNADDFGISPGVNRGVVEAYQHGIVTSASVMPNLPSAQDALDRAAVCPALALGAHLTLTTGRPLSPPDQVPTLVQPDGRFPLLGTLLMRLTLGQVRAADLECELDAQLAWLAGRGIEIEHINSHHHVHIHPRVAPIVARLAERYGVRAVRFPVESPVAAALDRSAPRDLVRTAIIGLIGRFTRRIFRKHALKSSRYFRGIGIGIGFGTAALLRTLRTLPRGVSELMTHPGHPDPELARWTEAAEGRDRELAALIAPESRTLIQEAGIRLVTYRELLNPAR